MDMKQSEIKAECEQAYQNIKVQEDKINQLQADCKHPNKHEGNYSYRPGSIASAIICSDCNKLIYTDWQKLRDISRKDI